MSFLWIPVTLAAALLQALRTADQRKLTQEIGNNGANLARYVIGAPVALLAFGLLLLSEPPPRADSLFYLSCLVGGIAQIAGTALLLQAIRFGSFAVGSTLAKTEAVQAALFSAVILGEHLPGLGWLGIVLATSGVALISLGGGTGAALRRGSDRAALAGLASAACFALSSVFIRNAALSLDGGSAPLRAVTTLAAITTMQVVLLGTPMLLLRDRGVSGLRAARRLTLRVGLMSIAGSVGWFLAMTLAPVAQVRALGQAELIFTILLARLRFRERFGAGELAGICAVGCGVVLLLLSTA